MERLFTKVREDICKYDRERKEENTMEVIRISICMKQV